MQIGTRRLLVAVVAALSIAPRSEAFETRLEVDPSVDVDALATSGVVAVKPTERQGRALVSDASAVLRVDASRILAVASDFGRYDDMKMPFVEDSRVVERQGPTVYVWTSMSMSGQASLHYLDVRLLSAINPRGSTGTMWEMIPRRAPWPYTDEPGFTRIDGSFYVEALPSSAEELPNTYVRYFLSASPDTSVPDFLVDLAAKNRIRRGVRNVIGVIAREAAALR